jgi:hypothetical protein
MHRVAQLKGYRPARAQRYLEDALDELNAMDELDSTLEYERKKGKKVVNSHGWKYDKLRDIYVLRKRVPTREELEAAAEKRKKKMAQPIEIERLAMDARAMWMQHSESRNVGTSKSTFINVAKRAQAFYEQYGNRLDFDTMTANNIHGLLKISLDILIGKSVPEGAHWWAQANFWQEELPVLMEDRGYLTPEGGYGGQGLHAGPLSDEEWEKQMRLEQSRGVPMQPEDADPCPDYED